MEQTQGQLMNEVKNYTHLLDGVRESRAQVYITSIYVYFRELTNVYDRPKIFELGCYFSLNLGKIYIIILLGKKYMFKQPQDLEDIKKRDRRLST